MNDLANSGGAGNLAVERKLLLVEPRAHGGLPLAEIGASGWQVSRATDIDSA